MHTPGPWTIEEKPRLQFDEFGNYLLGYVVSQEYVNVAEICGGIAPLEAQANARLIAQAPAMLEVLEELLDMIKPIDGHPDTRNSVLKAQVIIAQAKGA